MKDVLILLVIFAALVGVIFIAAANEPPRGCMKGHTVQRWFGQAFVCEQWTRP